MRSGWVLGSLRYAVQSKMTTKSEYFYLYLKMQRMNFVVR